MSVGSRKLVGSSVLLLLSGGSVAAFLVLWPRPVSLILAGISLLCVFSAVLVFLGAATREYALQVQRAIFLTFGSFGLAFAGLAWKYHARAPAFSWAALIALAIVCFGALATWFLCGQAKSAKAV